MRSYSLISMMMSGVRIAGELDFTPAHISANGKRVNDRVGVPVCANSRRGQDQGKPGRMDNYKLVAWGGLALSLCRFGSTGKALDVIVEPHSYEGAIYKLAPNPTNPAEMTPQAVIVGGQTLTTEKIGFKIINISYGEESAKQIQRELEKGASEPGCLGGRPPQWNVIGTADAAQFAQILEQRKAMVWDGASPYFGFARVVLPRNAQRILNVNERAAIVTEAATRRASFATPVNTVDQVASTFQGQAAPITSPVAASVMPTATPIAAVTTTPMVAATAVTSQGF